MERLCCEVPSRRGCRRSSHLHHVGHLCIPLAHLLHVVEMCGCWRGLLLQHHEVVWWSPRLVLLELASPVKETAVAPAPPSDAGALCPAQPSRSAQASAQSRSSASHQVETSTCCSCIFVALQALLAQTATQLQSLECNLTRRSQTGWSCCQ